MFYITPSFVTPLRLTSKTPAEDYYLYYRLGVEFGPISFVDISDALSESSFVEPFVKSYGRETFTSLANAIGVISQIGDDFPQNPPNRDDCLIILMEYISDRKISVPVYKIYSYKDKSIRSISTSDMDSLYHMPVTIRDEFLPKIDGAMFIFTIESILHSIINTVSVLLTSLGEPYREKTLRKVQDKLSPLKASKSSKSSESSDKLVNELTKFAKSLGIDVDVLLDFPEEIQ